MLRGAVFYVIRRVGVPIALATNNTRTGIATIYQYIEAFSILTRSVGDIKYLNNFIQKKINKNYFFCYSLD